MAGPYDHLFLVFSTLSSCTVWFTRWQWGAPKQPFSLHTFDTLPSKVLPPAPSRLLCRHSNRLIKECWIICISTTWSTLLLTPTHPTSGRALSLPTQLVPSSLAINPAGQIHRKLPSVFSQRPWEQRCWAWAHSSMSVNKSTMGKIRAVQSCCKISVFPCSVKHQIPALLPWNQRVLCKQQEQQGEKWPPPKTRRSVSREYVCFKG